MSIEIVPAQFSTVGLTGYISAGTTNASLGTVVFSNSNGVSFGMNAGIVTASVVAGAAAGIGAAGAGSQTQTSGTLIFSNSNNISFGMSNSSIVTASYSQSNQTGNYYVSGNTTQLSSTAGVDLRSVSFEGAGNVSIGVSNGRVLVSGVGGAGGGIAAAAGTQTQTSGTMAFVNSNGISFGMSNSSQVTASYTVPTQSVQTQNRFNATLSGNSTSAGAGYIEISSGTMTLAGGNNITLSQNGNAITISGANAGGVQTGISGVIASNATYTSGTISFSDANGISFGTSAGQAINITHGLQYTSATSAITSNALHSSASKVAGIIAGTASNGGTATLTGNVSFSNANGISFYTSAGNAVVGTVRTDYQSAGAYLTTARASNDAIGLNTALTANGVAWTVNSSGLSLNVPEFLTTAAQSNHSHNFATTTTNGSLMVVATTNSAGATVAVPPYITTYAAQTNQTGNFYVSGNTTQLSSTAGLDLRSISFEGAGIASVGVSNGRVLVSVPSGGGAGDGYNIVYAGTAGTTGTTWSSASASVRINGGNNITVSQNGSNDIVISAAQGGIAAGTQTATSGTLVFANSNGVTFGMSGSSQITASVNAGGGAGYTALTMQNRQLGASTTLNSAGGQNSLWLAPVRVAAPVSASTILAAMISYSGTITSAATAQVGQTLRVGIWSQLTDPASTSRFDTWWTGAASITAWNSGTSSVSYNFSLAGGATTSSSAGSNLLTANFMGARQIIIPIGSTMQTGLYVFGILNSTSSAGYSAAMSRIALYMDNPLSLGMGTIGQATNASNGYVDGGTYLTTTGALPNTLALNQIGVVNNVMPYFKVGAI